MTEPIERAIELPAPPDRVWAALVDAEQLSAWFGARVEIEARPGGSATFAWPDGTVRRASVVALEPQRLLLLRWLPFAEDARGRRRALASTQVRFVLDGVEAGTRLLVQESAPLQEASAKAGA